MIDYAYTVELTQRGLSLREPFIPRLLVDTLSGLGAAIEANERGEAVCPRVDFSIWATPKAKGFIDPLKIPEDLYVDIFEYNARTPAKRFRRFSGVLVELPRRGKSADEDVFIFSATGFLSTYDEVDVVDSVSGGAYRDTHFEDLIPALTAAAGHGALSVSTGTPIKAADRWTSRLFYPGKHRFGGSYILTDKIKAICNDGTYIYLGVGHWLCRYDPATRASLKLARLNYTGALDLRAWEFRIVSIEETGGNIVGWAESVIPDIKETDAHVKISFNYAGGNLINLTDANLIYCHDRGYYMRSRNVNAENNGGPSTNDWAVWRCEQIGDATAPSDKTLGIPQNITTLTGTMNVELKIGEQIMKECSVAPRMANVGDRVHIKWLDWYQDMGEITKLVFIKSGGVGTWNYHVQYKSQYNFPNTSWIFVYPRGYESVGPNLALPGFRSIDIEYELPDGIGNSTALPVTVERRRDGDGRTTYYWPEIYGTADETFGPFVPGPYVSLGEGSTPREYIKDPLAPPNSYYHSESVPDFRVKVENAAHFANLPPDDYEVRNVKQADDQTQPGENVLYYNGNEVKITNEASKVLGTRGNIYLAKEGNTVYVAWNRYRWAKGDWFLQVVWGKLNGATVKKVGEDRYYKNYQSRPPREITGFAVFNSEYYIAVKRIEPRWKNTAMQIVWAAPPQTELKPTNYDGGLVATALVRYDKTDYLRTGRIIRVRTKGRPVGDKEYLISEVDTLMHEIATTEFSSRTYYPEKYTRLVLFALDPFEKTPGAYKAQARKELLDKYITIMEGYDIRGEICYADGQELKVGHTAIAAFGEAFDGDRYDYEKDEWHGETVVPDEYGIHAEADLAERRVRPATVKVTMIGDKREFVVTDMTDNLLEEIPIPPQGEVYIQTREGGEYDETLLYFNPVYLGGRTNVFSSDVEITMYMEGQSFDVEYEHYTDRFFVEPFILDDVLYFNETETGAIYWRQTDTKWNRAAAWPAPVASVTVLGKDVYALAASDFALMKYGREWPGYINAEVGGADPISVFTALTKIAQAADCFLGEENGKIMIRPREQSKSAVMNAEFEDFETCQYIEQKQYRGVLITYEGGKAYVGQNDPPEDLILKRSAPYVFDYGLALELASKYYAYFVSGAIIYDVETARRELQVPMLAETVDVGELSGRLIKYELRGPKIGMLIEKIVGGRLGIGD